MRADARAYHHILNFYEGDPMRRLIARFLIASMLLPCLLVLNACKGKGTQTPQPPAGNPPAEEKAPALYIPTQSDFSGHNTEDFSTLSPIFSAKPSR